MRTALVAIAVITMTGPAAAAPPAFGVRVGVTEDPDSIFVGGHAAFDDLGGIRHLRLEPSIDLGYGERNTVVGDLEYYTIRLNGNVEYLIPIGGGGEMFFYPVGGLSVYYWNLNDCPGGDCDDTELGINLGFGFEFQRFAVDLWFGFDDEDLPDFTLVGSYTFP